MKRCPECRRDYFDETLLFCLDDGERLLEGPASGDEPVTAIQQANTNEAPTRTFAAQEEKEDTHRASNRSSMIAGFLGIVLVSALGLGSYFYYGRDSSKQIDSIAVLPFVNETGDAELEYLSDGMTESLINSLSNVPSLSVKARNSVFRYKGKDIDEKQVGRELSVQAMLMGRMIQRGENITLSLSLVDTETGRALWGEQYDRKMQELAVLQKDITRDISQKLRTRLSNADAKALTKNYSENAEAYQLYLKGRFFWAKRTSESVAKSIEYFDLAIEKDPDFPLAYVGLADAYVVPANQMAPKDAMPKAKAAAMRALELDDNLAEAHTSLARVLQVYDWNWKEAEREFKRAIELNPRYPIAHQWYGGYLERTGRLDEAAASRRLALELDPLSAITNFELGQTFYFARDYDRAIEQLNKTLELEPTFPAALQYIPLVYAQKGMLDKALELAQAAPSNTSTLGYVNAIAGRTEEARAMIENLKARRQGPQYTSPLNIASVYAALGEKDQAFEWLEKGYEERAFQMQLLNLDPRWDKIRDDPRFVNLTERVGLVR